MLETMLDRHIIFVLMGILTAVGIMSKFIVNVALKRLVRAAGNMNKSTHPLMRLVRAKFEHASMVSDKVENVKVFVDKYLYEYKVLGLRLHSWRRMEKAAAALCLLTGAVGAGLEYGVNGMSDLVWKTGAVGGGLAAFVYLVHLLTDEKYQLEAVQNYMVDFLENVCRHRFEKSYQKEIKVLAQDGSSAEFGVMPAEGQDNGGEAYAVRRKETAEDLFAVRNLEQADEVYAAKKREGSKGQSAVSAFLAAELQAGESGLRTQEIEPDERGNTYNDFRTQETVRNERASEIRLQEKSQSDGISAFSMPEQEQNDGVSTFWTPEPKQKVSVEIEAPKGKGKRKENIVEIPVPEASRDSIEKVVIETPEPSNSARNPQARQTLQKERIQRREKTEEDVDRDVVIRRILEEFMA